MCEHRPGKAKARSETRRRSGHTQQLVDTAVERDEEGRAIEQSSSSGGGEGRVVGRAGESGRWGLFGGFLTLRQRVYLSTKLRGRGKADGTFDGGNELPRRHHQKLDGRVDEPQDRRMGRGRWRWKDGCLGIQRRNGLRGGYYARDQREKVAEVLLRDWRGVFLVRLGGMGLSRGAALAI